MRHFHKGADKEDEEAEQQEPGSAIFIKYRLYFPVFFHQEISDGKIKLIINIPGFISINFVN